MGNSPVRVAILGILCVILFQWFVVQGHGGNWTLLFCSGDKYPPPPDLAGKMYQFPNSHGFDGQFYFYIAHDFTDARGTSTYIDYPPMRWLRALIPALVAALSMGNPEWVLPAYIGVTWLLCALGLWLSANLFVLWGLPASGGLGFLAIPAVLISLDRMMTDLAFVVVLLGLAYASAMGRMGWVYALLVLAPLARETGLALTGGWVLYQVWRREWRPALLGCLTALPFAAWIIYVAMKFGRGSDYFLGAPFSAVVRRLFNPVIYDVSLWGHKVAAATDYIGSWGVAASFVLVVLLFVRGERSMLMFCALVYTLGIAFFVKDDMWAEAYSYARTGAPPAIILAMVGVRDRRWWLLTPMLMALPRVLFQYASMAWVAGRGWL
ncbi:MAG: hypothetical protein U5J83_09635 [Bryobacterales bacterium]|nr:hypothetical protein [Bryobacterales bacterium]